MADMHSLEYFKDKKVRVLYEKQTVKDEEWYAVLGNLEGILKDYDDVFLYLERKKKITITVEEQTFWGKKEIAKDAWQEYSVLIKLSSVFEIVTVPDKL